MSDNTTASEANVSVDQAKLLASVVDPHQPPLRKDWDDHLVYRLANTVIDQAARIAHLEGERDQPAEYAPYTRIEKEEDNE